MNDAKRVAGQDEFLTLALGDLTDKQRYVVECYYGLKDGNEYNVIEIAEMMGVTHQAVSKTLRRALVLLQETAGRLHTGIERELLSPVQPVGEEEEGVERSCSPFIPSHYGLPPRAGFKLLDNSDDDDPGSGLPYGFHIDTL